MIQNKKQMFALIGAFILTIILGTVTYAFFNYTRTGASNVIKTGRISFNHRQRNSINLTNMFPIESNATNLEDSTKVGSVTINVTGDTTYGKGIEYLVTAVNVTNTVGSGANAKELPISINVTVEDNDNNNSATTIGTSDEEYFDNRGSSASTSIYKVLASDVISNNAQLLVGYIKSGSTGVDGNIVIKAYIDKNKVVISDTYPAEVTDTNSDGYLDGTPTSFGEGKTIFTTTEWNSLQQNGVSFQVKVEANEGIWVEEIRTVNAMGRLDPIMGPISEKRSDVVKIIFNKMGATRMKNAYDTATIKADLTENNEGKVLAWLEENEDDNTMYNLIVASDGDTYFPQDSSGFFNFLPSVEEIEFNNINTSRVTTMIGMFYLSSALKSINVESFNTENVQDMEAMFQGCSALESIQIKGINTNNVTRMNAMFSGCSSITSIDVSGLGGNNLENTSAMFNNCTNLETINMHGFNFGKMTSLTSLFGNSHQLNNLKHLDMSDINLGSVTDLISMIYGFKSLIDVDLSGVDTSGVTNMTIMFGSNTSLQKIYVSDSWDTSSVTASGGMFDGCTSLVGQAPNASYAFDSNDAIDKTYARIATDDTKGYLTDISLKPTN